MSLFNNNTHGNDKESDQNTFCDSLQTDIKNCKIEAWKYM